MTLIRPLKPISASLADAPVVGKTDDALTRLAAPPGRELLFSPWFGEEHAIVFDANSGDFWVVSASGRQVLEFLSGATLTCRDIIARICNDPTWSIDEEDAATLLDSLLTQGLLAITPV